LLYQDLLKVEIPWISTLLEGVVRRLLLVDLEKELEIREQTVPANTNPLLLSGFALTAEDSTHSLSATLQLDADLASLSPTELGAIARAEYRRLNALPVKNYTLTNPPRAAVIAADPQLLEAFREKYGGLLELVALLHGSQTGGRDEGVDVAEELVLEKSSGGALCLRYNVRRPLDPQLCTRCRECVTVCEPGCIDFRLDLDFSHCDYCGRCQEACPAGAIELHARLERRVEVPAVILLDETGLEIPEDTPTVYSAGQIDVFLCQVGCHEITEVVEFTAGLCQYSTRLGRGCNLCLEACPAGALFCGEAGIEIDHLACNACGGCVAVCPTGALQDGRFRDRELVDWFREVPAPTGGTLVLGSEEQLADLWWRHPGRHWEQTLFLELPGLGFLSSFHFLWFFALGWRRIVLLSGAERDTATHPQPKVIAFVAALLRELYDVGEFVVETSPDRFADCLAGLEPKSSLPGPAPWQDFSFAGRRRKFAELLSGLLAARTGSENADRVAIAAPDFALLDCDAERCTVCCACLNECRTGALSADSAGYQILHEAALCVACGICVAVCPEEALTLAPGLVLDPSFFENTPLAQDEPVFCRECGAPFGTRKSYEQVLRRLRATGRFAAQEEFLAYCETCRAQKVFTAHAE
jgi:ferredoxin